MFLYFYIYIFTPHVKYCDAESVMNITIKAYSDCFSNSNGRRDLFLKCFDNFIIRVFKANNFESPDFEEIDRSWFLTTPSWFFYAKVTLLILSILLYLVYIIICQLCYKHGDRNKTKSIIRRKITARQKSILEKSVVRAHALLCAWMMLGIFFGFCAWFDRKIYDKQFFRIDYDNTESMMIQPLPNTTSVQHDIDMFNRFAMIENNTDFSIIPYSNEIVGNISTLSTVLNSMTCGRVYAWCNGNLECYLEYTSMIWDVEIINPSDALYKYKCIMDYDYNSLRSFSFFAVRLLEKMNDLKLFCAALPVISVVAWYERTSSDYTKYRSNSNHSNGFTILYGRRLIYNVYIFALVGCLYFGLGIWDSTINYSYAHNFNDVSKVKAFGDNIFDTCYPKKNDVNDDMINIYETSYFKSNVFRWRSIAVCICCVIWAMVDMFMERLYDWWINSKNGGIENDDLL